jgi:hypothetical protein
MDDTSNKSFADSELERFESIDEKDLEEDKFFILLL